MHGMTLSIILLAHFSTIFYFVFRVPSFTGNLLIGSLFVRPPLMISFSFFPHL